jgi:hypothetical protein
VGKAAVITLRVKIEIALVHIETHIERKAVFAVWYSRVRERRPTPAGFQAESLGMFGHDPNKVNVRSTST